MRLTQRYEAIRTLTSDDRISTILRGEPLLPEEEKIKQQIDDAIEQRPHSIYFFSKLKRNNVIRACVIAGFLPFEEISNGKVSPLIVRLLEENLTLRTLVVERKVSTWELRKWSEKAVKALSKDVLVALDRGELSIEEHKKNNTMSTVLCSSLLGLFSPEDEGAPEEDSLPSRLANVVSATRHSETTVEEKGFTFKNFLLPALLPPQAPPAPAPNVLDTEESKLQDAADRFDRWMKNYEVSHRRTGTWQDHDRALIEFLGSDYGFCYVKNYEQFCKLADLVRAKEGYIVSNPPCEPVDFGRAIKYAHPEAFGDVKPEYPEGYDIFDNGAAVRSNLLKPA